MIRMILEELKLPFTWEYGMIKSAVLSTASPTLNGMVRNNTYHSILNLVITIDYKNGVNDYSATCRECNYDSLMRPIQYRDSGNRATTATARDFTCNNRSILLKDLSRHGTWRRKNSVNSTYSTDTQWVSIRNLS